MTTIVVMILGNFISFADGSYDFWFKDFGNAKNTGSIQIAGPIKYQEPFIWLTGINYTEGKKSSSQLTGIDPTTPVVGPDGTIYVSFLCFNTKLLALNHQNAAIKWSLPLTKGSTPSVGPDGTIYIMDIDVLKAITPEGQEKWRRKIETNADVFSFNSSTISISKKGNVYVNILDEGLFAFLPDGTKKWELRFENRSIYPAIDDNENIFVETSAGVVAYSPEGKKVWTAKLPPITYVIYTAPVIDKSGNIILMRMTGKSTKRTLFSISPTAKLNWSFDLDESEFGQSPQPVVNHDGTIYINLFMGVTGLSDESLKSRKEVIYALNGDGKLIKKTEIPSRNRYNDLTIDKNNNIYMVGEYFYIFDRDLNIIEKFNLNSDRKVFSTQGIIGIDGTLYFGGHSNNEIAYFALGGINLSGKISLARDILDKVDGVANDDFKNYKWNLTTKEQVKKSENRNIYRETDNGLLYHFFIDAHECYLLYEFSNNLNEIIYVINPIYQNPNDYIKYFSKIKELFNQNYGEPIQDEAKWNKNTYKNFPDQWGKAVSMGELYYHAQWLLGRTTVELLLRGRDNRIHLSASYRRANIRYKPNLVTVKDVFKPFQSEIDKADDSLNSENDLFVSRVKESIIKRIKEVNQQYREIFEKQFINEWNVMKKDRGNFNWEFEDKNVLRINSENLTFKELMLGRNGELTADLHLTQGCWVRFHSFNPYKAFNENDNDYISVYHNRDQYNDYNVSQVVARNSGRYLYAFFEGRIDPKLLHDTITRMFAQNINETKIGKYTIRRHNYYLVSISFSLKTWNESLSIGEKNSSTPIMNIIPGPKSINQPQSTSPSNVSNPSAVSPPPAPKPQVDQSPAPSVTQSSSQIFRDAKLAQAISEEIGKPIASIIPEDLAQITKLRPFITGIKDLSGIEQCTNLEELVLSNNQINDASPLGKLTKLKSLHLANNNLKDIQFLTSMSQLKFLNLENNQLTDITPLSALKNLTLLHLESNQIKDIQALEGLSNLNFLWLTKNNITNIDVLLQLPNLRMVIIDQNPLDMSGRKVIKALKAKGCQAHY